jgi:hypothetical protein
LFFLVLPDELFRDSEIPIGWGALVESNGALTLLRKPIWQESPPEKRVRLLQHIAAAGTRMLNRQLEITFDDSRGRVLSILPVAGVADSGAPLSNGAYGVSKS